MSGTVLAVRPPWSPTLSATNHAPRSAGPHESSPVAELISPTNRSRNTSLSDTSCIVGIDTIRVGGPIHPDKMEGLERTTRSTLLDRSTGELREGGTSGFELLPDSGVKFETRWGRAESSYWVVELSVPRVLHEHNAAAASPDELLDCLERLTPVITDRLGDVGPLDGWQVSRLDLVRDFHGVRAASLHLDGLSRLPVPYAKVNALYRAPSDGHVSGLRRGTEGRYVASLYDKHEEERVRLKAGDLHAVNGHLRYEVGLRRAVLREQGMTRVADITQDKITSLARRRFIKCHYDKEVRGMDRVGLEIELRLDELSKPERKRLPKMLGILQMQSIGVVPDVSAGCLKSHMDLAAKLKVSAADFAHRGDHALRLDFDSGTQISR